MHLNQHQLDTIHRDGFLLLPSLFSNSEIDRLSKRLPALWSERCQANILEKDSDTVRMTLALHKRDKRFAELVVDPRLVTPAQQLRPEPLYIQQTKVNNKAPNSKDIWQWHHDFGNHRINDGIARPLALNIHVFLDDVDHFNGPICFIPGSHVAKDDTLIDHNVFYDDQTSSFAVWAVDDDVVKHRLLAAEKRQAGRSIVAATGVRGSALIFFDTTLHCSPANISLNKRSIFSMIVNPVSNKYTIDTRPDHLHHKDLTPLPNYAVAV